MQKLPRNTIFDELCLSASYAKHPAMFFKLSLLSKLLDKYYRTAFQPGSFDANLGFEVRVLLLQWGLRRQSHNIAPLGSLLSVEMGKQLGSPPHSISYSSTGASTFALHQHLYE